MLELTPDPDPPTPPPPVISTSLTTSTGRVVKAKSSLSYHWEVRGSIQGRGGGASVWRTICPFLRLGDSILRRAVCLPDTPQLLTMLTSALVSELQIVYEQIVRLKPLWQ